MSKTIFIIGIVVSILITVALMKWLTRPDTILVTDTLTVERYSEKVKHDTVIKWYEKVIYKEVEPEKIYVEKIDSVFIETIKYKDLILRVEKSRNKLSIFAVNLQDSLLKEYNFADVGQEWTATSVTGNVFLRSKRITWYGIEPYIFYSQNDLKDWTLNKFGAGIRTGIVFNRLKFTVGAEFSEDKGKLKLESSYNF